MPFYLYPLFLIVKTPLPILVALAVGLVEIWKRRTRAWRVLSDPHVPVLDCALLAAERQMAKIHALLDADDLHHCRIGCGQDLCLGIGPGEAARIAGGSRLWPRRSHWYSWQSQPGPVRGCNPYYTLYLNPLGLGRTGYYFPHDEMNDMGLREAIAQICDQAPKGASVGGETAPVFAYYFHRFGRDDLHYFDLSDQAQRMLAPPTAYIVVQDGRKYFENMPFIQRVESYQVPIHTIEIDGAAAVRVYRDEQFAELRIGR